MTKALKECDLVMKGGITSGVVYPKAIVRLATEYRFRDIGGSSAGAIAAVLAAAAEYRRQTCPSDPDRGFRELKAVDRDLAKRMPSLIQPKRSLRPLFEIMMAMLKAKPGQSKVGAFLAALPRIFPIDLLVALFAGACFFVLLNDVFPEHGRDSMFGTLLSLVAAGLMSGAMAFGFILWRIKWLVTRALVSNDFGICPGIQQSGFGGPAFVDWMHTQIENLAGQETPRGGPMTCGNLKDQGVTIASMTTDLATRRPYRLPLQEDEHYFSETEFRRILPDDVVTAMVKYATENSDGRQFVGNKYDPEGLYVLPVGDAFPVLLVARMSLSFPGLISAVPLYRIDKTLNFDNPIMQLRRCLFSDGGISSNFPIHIFDNFLPSRPTFGISLGPFDKTRGGGERTYLPDDGVSDMAVWEVRSVPAFMMSIVNTAKDWQDSLQSSLPGYAERIVQIRLAKSEGGMNLKMESDTITRLTEYGSDAADKLLSFDFDDHRYRRAITFLPTLEGKLAKMAETYKKPSASSDSTYRDILLGDYESADDCKYGGDREWREGALEPFAESLVALGEDVRCDRNGPKRVRVNDRADLPKVDSDIRLVASAERSQRG